MFWIISKEIECFKIHCFGGTFLNKSRITQFVGSNMVCFGALFSKTRGVARNSVKQESKHGAAHTMRFWSQTCTCGMMSVALLRHYVSHSVFFCAQNMS